MGSLVGGLGYLVKYVYCEEANLVRIHRGLRRYLSATPEIS
jgi:hypothetical protein